MSDGMSRMMNDQAKEEKLRSDQKKRDFLQMLSEKIANTDIDSERFKDIEWTFDNFDKIQDNRQIIDILGSGRKYDESKNISVISALSDWSKLSDKGDKTEDSKSEDSKSEDTNNGDTYTTFVFLPHITFKNLRLREPDKEDKEDINYNAVNSIDIELNFEYDETIIKE